MQGKPHFQIGKAGVTPGVIRELEGLLRKHHVIKVKILKNLLKRRDRVPVAREVAEALKARLIEVRGNSFILSKRPIPKFQRKIPAE